MLGALDVHLSVYEAGDGAPPRVVHSVQPLAPVVVGVLLQLPANHLDIILSSQTVISLYLPTHLVVRVQSVRILWQGVRGAFGPVAATVRVEGEPLA